MTEEIKNQPTAREPSVAVPSSPQGTQTARAMALRGPR